MSRTLALLVVLGALGTGMAGGVGCGGLEPNVSIVEVYPNPVADGDAGEYIALSVPPGTNLTGWTLSDDHATVALPNVTASGRVVLSTDPAFARNLTEGAVAHLAGHIPLANDGETLTVRDGECVLARLSYERAPEGQVGHVTNGSLEWSPPAETDFSVRTGGPGQVRTFVLPDAGGFPVDVLASADDRILLAGYTFSSEQASETLIAAKERGVNVQVLLEGGPVGGMSMRQAELLDRLVARNVTVRVVAGPYARVSHHHAKYAVVDDRALVLTENWKPAGTGGRSSRGWGVETAQPRVVTGLVDTFRADAGWRDAIPWPTYREGRSFAAGNRSTRRFSERHSPQSGAANATALLVAPDNAESAVIDRIDAATRSVDVVQVSLGGTAQSFVRALKRAADRGVRVRILLSRAWYAREDNRKIATRLESWARRNDAALSVRLARPRDRFGKIHAKGAIVDGRTVLVGSLNWNDHSARQNREVVLAIEGEEPAAYFARVFAGDWRAVPWRLPIGLVGAVCGVVIVAGIVATRIAFGHDTAGKEL